jgi:hypothetical protein
MYDNRLTADQLAALAPGDTVIAKTNRGTWSGYDIRPVTVARLTRTQLIVHEPGPRGPLEFRFRRDDGSQIGDRGLLLDADHPDTIRALAAVDRKRAEERIDALAHTWRRDRNPDTLRRLHAAITDHLAAETTTEETAP